MARRSRRLADFETVERRAAEAAARYENRPEIVKITNSAWPNGSYVMSYDSYGMSVYHVHEGVVAGDYDEWRQGLCLPVNEFGWTLLLLNAEDA